MNALRDIRNSEPRWGAECDVAVVGTGAAGATVGVYLAQAGLKVALLEEGGPWNSGALTNNVWRTAQQVFRESGSTFLRGPSLVATLQGRVVGGSTVINSAICWRLPERVHAEWASRDPAFAAAHPYATFDAHADIIERDLSVGAAPPEALGGNNGRLKQGAEALGWQSHPIRRAVSNCAATALCLQGCPSGAKQSMALTYIPRAVAAGAQLLPWHRVKRVHLKNNRAVGVEISVERPSERAQTVHLRARVGVVLAASALQTPTLLMASGLGRVGPVGKHLQCHPGVGVAAIFPASEPPVNMWRGATQGYEVDEFSRDGIKIESLALPPELLALRLPGWGQHLGRWLDRASHVAVWGAQVRAEAHGEVRRSISGKAAPRIAFTARDMAGLRRGLRISTELAFAAGAELVLPGIYGLPESVDSLAALDRHLEHFTSAKQVNLIATHLFGTARMGRQPTANTVDLRYQVHGTSRLWVADSSIFPTNLGVNPQISIMTLARRCADLIANESNS